MRVTRIVVMTALALATAVVGALVHADGPGAVAAPAAAGAKAKTAPPPPGTDWVTFYGAVDNSPPGGAIAHPCIHRTAGGVGTYANPVTFAEPTDPDGPWCQIVYVPFLEKYFIHEDLCDPCGGLNTAHVDLWMGGTTAPRRSPERRALLSCEDTWTRDAEVVQSPPPTERVDTTPLFTPPSTCHGGAGD